MNKPIVGLTLFFIAGIVLGRYLSLPFLSLYLTFLLLFSLSVIFYLKGRKRLVGYLLFSLSILAGSLYFSYLYFPHSPSHIVNFTPSKEALYITGKVINRPKLKGKTLQFIMEVEKIASEKENRSQKIGREKGDGLVEMEKEVKGKVRVISYLPLQNYDYGDEVEVKGKLTLPKGEKEEGGFNWQKYLSYQGIWVELSTGKVELIKRGRGNPLVKWAYRSRDWMVRLIEHTLPQPSSSVLKAIMLGDKDSLPLEVKNKFLKTGTGHILVVSGLHVGLILLILFVFFRTLGLSFKLTSLLVVPILAYYAVLTGLRPPVLRATLMAGVGLACLLINRDISPLVILGLAALFILILSPLSLFTASFQLSFIAVGGIIYLTPYLEKRLEGLPLWLRRPLAISLAAQLSVLPLLAFYFHQIPLIGLLTNLLIAPLVTIILALGFFSLALGSITLGGAQIIANANWLALTSLLRLVSFFSFSQSRPISNLFCPGVGSFSPILLIIYYGGLGFLPYLFKFQGARLKSKNKPTPIF
ncbi:MAG: ComEC/Rec2 family competence protein [bacterium]